jgi:hypothetical protein
MTTAAHAERPLPVAAVHRGFFLSAHLQTARPSGDATTDFPHSRPVCEVKRLHGPRLLRGTGRCVPKAIGIVPMTHTEPAPRGAEAASGRR